MLGTWGYKFRELRNLYNDLKKKKKVCVSSVATEIQLIWALGIINNILMGILNADY